MEFDTMLQATAVVSTIFQFLSGSIVCRKYFQKKSVGDSSGFPFVCGFLSCSFWLRYGILINDDCLILVNFIGATLFFIYSMVYYIFTINQKLHIKQMGLALIALISVTLYTGKLEDHNEAIRIMGIICCIVTVCFFAAPLTMLVHVIRVKNSESLPFPLIAMTFFVSIQWLIYGIMISDTFIQIPNFLGCLLSLLQLLLFVCYPPKSYHGQGYKLVDQSVVF